MRRSDNMTKEIEHIFCPKCKSFALECESCDMPEWVGDERIGAIENYVCSNCGHEFTVATGYTLTSFSFPREDDDEVYTIIEEE